MINLADINNQIHYVSNFQDLINTDFREDKNAFCWHRTLKGDFSEIVDKMEIDGNIATINQENLVDIQLSKAGELARDILLADMKMLTNHGGSPILNLIESYDRDDSYPYFPTDVYSFHVDRSPIPVDTFLCTYHGDASDIIPNSQATQKILVPEIRNELKKLHDGADEDFESFLAEYFFDLHYQANPGARPMNLGIGHMWRLAIDHPESQVLPCIHRAPIEKSGKKRLLMIC